MSQMNERAIEILLKELKYSSLDFPYSLEKVFFRSKYDLPFDDVSKYKIIILQTLQDANPPINSWHLALACQILKKENLALEFLRTIEELGSYTNHQLSFGLRTIITKAKFWNILSQRESDSYYSIYLTILQDIVEEDKKSTEKLFKMIEMKKPMETPMKKPMETPKEKPMEKPMKKPVEESMFSVLCDLSLKDLNELFDCNYLFENSLWGITREQYYTIGKIFLRYINTIPSHDPFILKCEIRRQLHQHLISGWLLCIAFVIADCSDSSEKLFFHIFPQKSEKISKDIFTCFVKFVKSYDEKMLQQALKDHESIVLFKKFWECAPNEFKTM